VNVPSASPPRFLTHEAKGAARCASLSLPGWRVRIRSRTARRRSQAVCVAKGFDAPRTLLRRPIVPSRVPLRRSGLANSFSVRRPSASWFRPSRRDKRAIGPACVGLGPQLLLITGSAELGSFPHCDERASEMTFRVDRTSRSMSCFATPFCRSKLRTTAPRPGSTPWRGRVGS
jgi:hypothetical protein